MTRLMPALSDARTFTSYLSAGQREQNLQYALRVSNENQYRAKLQADAKAVESLLSRMTVAPARPAPVK